MKLVFFTKTLKALSVEEYLQKAHTLQLDGFDLCVRPAYAINPDNVESALPAFTAAARQDGLDVAMLTTNMADPADAGSERILRAMDKAGVRLAKLAYYYFGRQKDADYWAEVEKLRVRFGAWEKLARQYHVKLLYHTHSADEEGPNYMGSNAASQMHLLNGFDPACLGAYIDPAHQRVEGEQFDYAVAMTRKYLAAVALKDVGLAWDEKHYRVVRKWLRAGEGLVEWDLVFSELVRINFTGPISVHAEYTSANETEFFAHLPLEIAFFRAQLEKAQAARAPKYAHLSAKW